MTLTVLEIGPTWKMELLKGLLEENGVPAFVEDVNLKTIDPFMTGPMSFDARLRVPESAVTAAREVLEQARDIDDLEVSALASESAEGEPASASAAEVEDAEVVGAAADLEQLGARIRWSALLFWTHPLLLSSGPLYLRWTVRSGIKPRNHAWTLAALGFVAVLWAFTLVAGCSLLLRLL